MARLQSTEVCSLTVSLSEEKTWLPPLDVSTPSNALPVTGMRTGFVLVRISGPLTQDD